MNTSKWAERLPRTNRAYMIVSLVLVFGLDLFLVLGDSSLEGFWFEMIGVIAIFGLFYYLENNVLSEKFSQTTVPVDTYLDFVINLRNLFFVLNSIPLIQILGILLLTFAGIPLLVIYCLLIAIRFRQMNQSLPGVATSLPHDQQNQ